MERARLLIIEDDPDIAEMLRLYFHNLGYHVEVANRGQEGVEKSRQETPHLIILDIMLPDIDGYEVFQRIRRHPRTSHIPVIFLTQRDERDARIQGLELGADDYITKPFDMEELRLRVKNILDRIERERLTDPRTGLPSGRALEEYLRRILHEKDWALLDIWIQHFHEFRDVYGFMAANDVLRFTARLINQVVNELGRPEDFIGHPGDANFVVITASERAEPIRRELKQRFQESIQSHYHFRDRQRGYLIIRQEDGTERHVPLMSLAIGIVQARDYDFADIREVTEIAAEVRRRDMTP